MTRELRILCGAPGSGKSTWAKEEARRLDADCWSTAIISRDKIRFRLLDENPTDDYFAYEKQVFKEFVDEINECLYLGIDYIFADATHISYNSRAKLLRQLKIDPDITIRFDVFDLPLEVVLYRNSLREGRECVPVNAVKSMVAAFKAPTFLEAEDCGLGNGVCIVKHGKEE